MSQPTVFWDFSHIQERDGWAFVWASSRVEKLSGQMLGLVEGYFNIKYTKSDIRHPELEEYARQPDAYPGNLVRI